MRNDLNAPFSSFLSARSLHCYLLVTDAKAPCGQKTGGQAPSRPRAPTPAGHGAPATPRPRDDGPR